MPLPSSIPAQITIWIHGTRAEKIAAWLTPTWFYTPHDQSLNLSNFSKFEYELLYCPPGLHKTTIADRTLHKARIATTLTQSNPTLFHEEHIYFFGWSGKLDYEERKKAARTLWNELAALGQQYKTEYGTCPPIVMITHSHGGNVALNVAAVADDSMVIEKLILLACPVQIETVSLIESRLFKKIYSLHSHLDIIQILDVQGIRAIKQMPKKPWVGLSNFFSSRHFPVHPKLKQANLSWKVQAPWAATDLAAFGAHGDVVKRISSYTDKKKRGLLHVEFMLPSFIAQLDRIIKQLDNENEKVVALDYTIEL
jgi:hypothetical protein